ncbi:hypothetical protein Mal15_44200 [Stieleria maiorica]|uniref:Uncharacterized protein n=1 Tax=Stieleria maiorica TaxID=2795974 RepID=A0A5B9MIR5_9BACT|nr:hypothetical protein [Stieleria maiorica]QEG00350.1 hypothetical protein Mal15_44200 [Stieleria maiorica]
MNTMRSSAYFMVLAGLFSISTSPVDAVGFGHFHPYYDQHFNPDSTRRTTLVYLSHAWVSDTASGHCSPVGSRSGGCPPIDNALLRLHVRDDVQVEINGYQTKPQTLAGIHRNSRFYSLTGLRPDRILPCDIVVIETDMHGNQRHYHHAFGAQAGQVYDIRFPQDFRFHQAVFAPVNSEVPAVPIIPVDEVLPESVIQSPQSALAPPQQPAD